MPETMQNESPKHQNVVNTRGKPGKNNANANRHEIQKKFPKRKKKEFPNQLRSLYIYIYILGRAVMFSAPVMSTVSLSGRTLRGRAVWLQWWVQRCHVHGPSQWSQCGPVFQLHDDDGQNSTLQGRNKPLDGSATDALIWYESWTKNCKQIFNDSTNSNKTGSFMNCTTCSLG